MPVNSLEAVRAVVAEVLQLPGGAASLSAESRLLGFLPELDSMSVVALLTALEEHFGMVIADEDLHASHFDSVRSLADFVDSRRLVG